MDNSHLEFEIPEDLKGFKYSTQHLLHATSFNREIQIEFSCERMPGEKPLIVARLMISPLHARELELHLRAVLDDIRQNPSGDNV